MSQSKRAPFEPISQLTQVPIALLEALALVRDGDSRADALLSSIINVTLTNPNAWAEVAGLQPGEPR